MSTYTMVLLLDGSVFNAVLTFGIRHVLPEKKVGWTTAVDVNKCLELVKIPISLPMCAFMIELPSNIGTMTHTDIVYLICTL